MLERWERVQSLWPSVGLYSHIHGLKFRFLDCSSRNLSHVGDTMETREYSDQGDKQRKDIDEKCTNRFRIRASEYGV